ICPLHHVPSVPARRSSDLFTRQQHERLPWRYQLTVIANLLASYGMLIGFFLQGYGLYSIMASTATVAVSYVFAVMCWRDMAIIRSEEHTSELQSREKLVCR